jgi:hypothetical protein
MYGWMSGWAWVWMTFMMLFWIVLLGAVVYIAVKLGIQPRDSSTSEHRAERKT